MDVEVKGKTIVNISNTNSDEYITHKFPDDQGIYMELEDSQDGFTEIQEIDGNTMVNRSKTKDITPITHKYDDMSNYGGEISGVEAIGNVEIGKMTGRTMVNLSAIELETPITVDLGTVNGNNSAILTGLQDNGSVNVGKIEGQTLVNLSNTEAATSVTPNFDPIIDGTITNLGETTEGGNIEIGYIEGRTAVNRSTIENEAQVSYKKDVENTDQIMLPDTSEGIARLGAIEGNTLVNLSETEENTVITHDYGEFSDLNGKVVENIGESYIRLGNIEGETLVNVCDQQGFIEITNKTDMVDNRVIASPYGEETDSRAVIEGSTLVNVCDQKDPVAVTKAYSVESGNHVALQGEYDGKARPVVHGNTLVNLCTNKINARIITTGQHYVYLGLRNNLVANQPYTICLTMSNKSGSKPLKCKQSKSDTTVVYNHISSFSELGEGTHAIVITPTDDYAAFAFYMDPDTTNDAGIEASSVTISNVMILEGDYTNKPIPGYFEGIKSSFEDNKIPDTNLLNGLTPIKNVTYSANYNINVKANTLYTIVNPKITNHVYGIFSSDGNSTILGYRNTIRTFNTGTNSTIRLYCRMIKNDGTLVENSDGLSLDTNWNQGLYLFEGDWTHLAKEDFEHLGKYKVEYKVTGKNKFDGVLVYGDINDDTGNIIDTYTGNTISFNYIPVKTNAITITPSGLSSTPSYAMMYQYNENKKYIKATNINANSSQAKTLSTQCAFIKFKYQGKHPNLLIQIEEGYTATTYEPYKESTKTIYLNSPLLKDDVIQFNGYDWIQHCHNYEKIVLNGGYNENWSHFTESNSENITAFTVNIPGMNPDVEALCDKFICRKVYGPEWDCENFFIANDNYMQFRIRKSKLSTQDIQGFRTWLANNPITVVYKKNTPTYETWNNSDIKIDSYVNGHLDFNTSVPINSVIFKSKLFNLNYVYPNTTYTVQFESDSAGKLDYIYLEQGSLLQDVNVVKGINKVNLTQMYATNYPCVYFMGIGFNASNISVVATEREFNYFEGMSSSFESQLITDENDANYGKYKVEYRSIGKNKFDGQLIDGGFSTVTGVDTSDSDKKHSNLIKVKPNTSYTINSNFMVIAFYDHNKQFINTVYHSSKTTFTTPANCLYIKFRNYNSVTDWTSVQVQLEEGNTVTTYEPYKESIKTAYLNSPLLEGDKLEVINGKLCHVHNMKEIVLDGSENWSLSGESYTNVLGFYTGVTDYKANYNYDENLYCDKFKSSRYLTDEEGITPNNASATLIRIKLSRSKLSSQDIAGFKIWLSSNPIKVIYELANPWIEPLTTEDVTFKSFVNGHLSVESDVPVKLGYDGLNLGLKYLYPATPYTVKFISDKASIADIILGGTKLTNQNILAGENKFMMSTPDTLTDERLVINGTNANITDISVVNTVREYEHFEGIMNTYESEVLTNIAIEKYSTLTVPDPIAAKAGNMINLSKNISSGSKITIVGNIITNTTGIDLTISGYCEGKGNTTLVSNKVIDNKFVWVLEVRTDTANTYINRVAPSVWVNNNLVAGGILTIDDVMVFEGDLTDNYPTEYFTGSKYIANVTVCNNQFNFGSKGKI